MYGDCKKGVAANPTVKSRANSKLKPNTKARVRTKDRSVVTSSSIPAMNPIKSGTIAMMQGLIAVMIPPMKAPVAVNHKLLDESHC